LLNTSLKLPLWFPVDPKVSVDRNRGVFLNPEHTIPDNTNNWQITAGVSLPLGRGLFIDNRRATVKQAVLFQDILAADQVKIINKILLEATKDYWNWYFDYYNYRLLGQSIGIAQQIFDRVKLNYEYGEAAVIDTVQAQITLQNRVIEMQEAKINFIRSGLVLSNHFWGDNEEPLELSEKVAPVLDDSLFMIPGLTELQELRLLAEENHPEIRKLDAKLGQLAVENQLNRENLKPQLDVNYNLINAPISPGGETHKIVFDENYKFGFTFGFPLLLRKERAKIQLTNIKIQQTNYELNLRGREILNELEAAYAELTNTYQIIGQQTLAVDNYRRLLEAELYNLENGESDLFKINFQQDKLIQAQSKLLKLRSTFEKSRAMLYWAAGVENLIPG
jgi:outer membrane protein TolC